jgi:hypothetical protein
LTRQRDAAGLALPGTALATGPLKPQLEKQTAA